VGRQYRSEEWVDTGETGKIGFSAARRSSVADLDELRHGGDTALADVEERYRYTIALSPLIPWIADANGRLIDLDERGWRCIGLSREACMGSGFLAAVHVDDRPLVLGTWRLAQATGSHLDYEIRLQGVDGSHQWHRIRAAPRYSAAGSVLCWYGTIEDIHDRKLAHEAARWAADHDGLTGLWNRSAFMRGLRNALAEAQSGQKEVALLLIDLDEFKGLNDQHGHGAGDALLKEVARRLDHVGDDTAMAGRLGGDEFALFLVTSGADQLEEALAHLQEHLAIPYYLEDHSHICHASIGIAVYPGQGDDADTLYKNADLALYEAKNAGMNACRFQSSMRAGLQMRLSQLSVARDVLDRKKVMPFYQPKIDLASGQILGFEALLRWQHDTRGVQMPASIKAAFEDADLAIGLDERMFDLLALDIAGWLRSDVPFGRVAFNVSSPEFRREGFADRLLARLQRSGIPASTLELEVTESVFIGRSPEKVLSIFTQLRAAGLTIALDDFGMGYASLAHLKQFPIDVLKIDCSFVQALDTLTNEAIVKAIVGLGTSLGITTVAEGIETEDQADRLHRTGCDLGQGYLFSRAVPAHEVPGLFTAMAPGWRPKERRSYVDRRSSAAELIDQTRGNRPVRLGART
jgi:diguanylate cyclase (GGDEF)-like protein/PAS domain S-box-containing protein